MPLVPEKWLKETNPIYQSLSNVGVKKTKMRFLTHGPQLPNVPLFSDMWEWLIMQDAEVHFILPSLLTIGGIVIIVDGGEKILITSMNGTSASFIQNRESTIVMETKCERVAKLFIDTFNNDFAKGLPFIPAKEMIINSNPPLLDPVAQALIQGNVFKITSSPHPPTSLVESPLQPYLSNIMEADDVEYTLAMAGPEQVEWYILRAVNTLSSVQIATPSLTNNNIASAIYNAYKQNQSTSVNNLYCSCLKMKRKHKNRM